MTTSNDPLYIITGASYGIGQSIAEKLAKNHKERLLLVGRNHDKLKTLKTKCEELGAKEVILCIADLTIKKDIQNLINTCKENKPISTLINCAGMGKFGPIENFGTEDLDYLIDLNLKTPFLLIKEIAPLMKSYKGNKCIINISSDADKFGFPGAEAYCASKGGVKLLGRAASITLRKQGIRLSTISPGRVDTFFNNKQPGMRPGTLQATEVAEVVEFCIYSSPNLQINEIYIDSMTRDDNDPDLF